MRVLIHSCPLIPPSAPPAAGELHVWIVHFSHLLCDPDQFVQCLTPDERDRAGRYRIGPVRDQFVTCRGAIRRLLGGCLDVPPHAVPITYAANGKPVLVGGRLEFNVTHTTGLALLAVGTTRVGVDVERVRDVPDRDGLVERFFSLAERKAYRDLPADRRTAAFYRGWVCKEAVIKAAGASMQYLDGFDVELDPDRPSAVLAVRHPALAGTSWSVRDWTPAEGYAGAIATEVRTELQILMAGERNGKAVE